MDSGAIIISILTSIFGSAVVTVILLLAVERQRRPYLRFYREEPPAPPLKVDGKNAVILRIYVSNREIPRPLSIVYDREPAQSCRASIAFYDLNRIRVYSSEMPCRWSDTPNPILMFVPGQDGHSVPVVTNSEYLRNSFDIPPGSVTLLDVAIRCEAETECYGWNNDYAQYRGKNPDWKFKEGQYFIRLTVKTGGRSFVSCFRLINENEFRLEPAPLSACPPA
jgi:hypothetical protein